MDIPCGSVCCVALATKLSDSFSAIKFKSL